MGLSPFSLLEDEFRPEPKSINNHENLNLTLLFKLVETLAACGMMNRDGNTK